MVVKTYESGFLTVSLLKGLTFYHGNVTLQPPKSPYLDQVLSINLTWYIDDPIVKEQNKGKK